MISLLPLTLKSPIPLDMPVERRRPGGVRGLHLTVAPDRNRAIVVAPENVALAVAVEIARPHDLSVVDCKAV